MEMFSNFITYHRQFLLITRSTFQGKQRTIVTHLPLPLTMKIVRHHVYKVQIFGYFWYIVSRGRKKEEKIHN